MTTTGGPPVGLTEARPTNDVSESTYVWIKQLIAAVPKDSGEFLTEAEVARVTGASRTPVREALTRLEAEGLVNRIPKRGAFVPPLSETDMRHVMQAREMIELWGVDEFLRAERPDALARLTGLLVEQAGAAADSQQFIEIDSDFHGLIVGAAANEVVQHFYEELRARQVRMGVHAVSVSVRRADQVMDEHRQIVDALRAGDRTAARIATSNHLHRTLEAMLA